MKLFTIRPSCNKNSHLSFKPEEGIRIELVKDVFCLTLDACKWVRESLGDDPIRHILPLELNTADTDDESMRHFKDEVTMSQVKLEYASLHKLQDGIAFLREEDVSTDNSVIIFLALPVCAAQPYYEFEGDTEIILGAYANYYDSKSQVEKENALCSAIVRIGNNSKISFAYTNRYGQGERMSYMTRDKFEFTCNDGVLMRSEDSKFKSLFSQFIT